MTNSKIKSTYPANESRVILFGNPSDPEIAESLRKIKQTGREVITRQRANWDTGLGQCGNHLCHCKTICLEKYAKEQAI